MNGLRVRAIDLWKSCYGMCTICGMPLGLGGGRLKEDSEDLLPQSLVEDRDHAIQVLAGAG